MIRFANNNDIDELKKIWKVCFGDSDEFIHFFFSKKFHPKNTLIFYIDDRIVASLQMQLYNIRMYGQIVPFYYLVGLCTLNEYRNKGIMRQLIEESFEIMKSRKIPLSILIPAEDWLFDYYNKFGYEQTFEKGSKNINLKDILNQTDSLDRAFELFDSLYQQDDFCVLKNKNDFEAIVQDYKQDGYPSKFNQNAMSAIVDFELILSIYARSNKDKLFFIKIIELDQIYLVKNGFATSVDEASADICYLEIDKRTITRYLFGYKLPKENNYLNLLFEEHQPIINLMLE